MSAHFDTMTERDLQDSLVAEMQYRGWRVAHFRSARKQAGTWSTPVQYDGRGFPDVIATHPSGRIAVIECKSARGRLSTSQDDWLASFKSAGAETFVATPATFHDVASAIRSLTTGAQRVLST